MNEEEFELLNKPSWAERTARDTMEAYAEYNSHPKTQQESHPLKDDVMAPNETTTESNRDYIAVKEVDQDRDLESQRDRLD